jgi:Flp pilus assembly protein TadB
VEVLKEHGVGLETGRGDNECFADDEPQPVKEELGEHRTSLRLGLPIPSTTASPDREYATTGLNLVVVVTSHPVEA